MTIKSLTLYLIKRIPTKREKSTTQYLYSYGRNENNVNNQINSGFRATSKKQTNKKQKGNRLIANKSDNNTTEVKIANTSISTKTDIDKFLINLTQKSRRVSAGRNTTFYKEHRKTDYGQITDCDFLKDSTAVSSKRRLASPFSRLSQPYSTKRDKNFTRDSPKANFDLTKKKPSLAKSTRMLSASRASSTIVDPIALDSDKIENYEIEKRIGHGAFATVKCGREKLSGVKYAIKVYEKCKMVEKHKRVNVRREIDILKKVNHVNIVQLFKVFEDNRNVKIRRFNIRFILLWS